MVSKAIQTQVIAAIAQGYYNLLMLDKQMKIAESNLELSENTLTITQKCGTVVTLQLWGFNRQKHRSSQPSFLFRN